VIYAGEGICKRNLYKGETFIIFEPHVKGRLVGVNEIVFEVQRIGFGFGDDKFDVIRLLQEVAYHQVVPALKILAYSFF
ncbi:MAG: hypothetical protein QG657_2558, partial [Acidobacteriota bacterium]|nr:hypothetical protein [Acidobacteriota bacterium]